MIQVIFTAACVFLLINYAINLILDKKYNIFVK